MNLLSKEILNSLPPIGSTKEIKAKDVKVKLKLFTPDAQCSWYITEYDGDDLFYGFGTYGDESCAELGYMSKSELENLRGSMRLPVERDLCWDSNTSLEQVMNFSVR
jgi:hypothetical protein